MAPSLITVDDLPYCDINGTSNGVKYIKKISAWQEPSPAAGDFRSDIATTSTAAMLRAIQNAGLNDGWTGAGAKDFEAHMAQLTSRPGALFMISSTMGNQVALRTHITRPPTGLLCDERSHIIHMEAGGLASLSGALPQTVLPHNGLYLTLEDIKRKIVLADGRDACTVPTRIIHLENPLGGVIMPLAELCRIKDFATTHDIKVHIDGARLWEAVASGAGSLAQYCNAADSVNLCLTKGIGAPIGSIIVGEKEFVHHARWVRKSIGGAMRQPGFVAACAWAAVDETFGRDPSGQESLLRRSHDLARSVAEHWRSLGGRLTVPQETNMVWLDFDEAGIDEEEWETEGERHGLRLHSSRLVMHYQTSDDAILRLKALMTQFVTDPLRKGPIYNPVPRNEAVSRLAVEMKESIATAALQRGEMYRGF